MIGVLRFELFVLFPGSKSRGDRSRRLSILWTVLLRSALRSPRGGRAIDDSTIKKFEDPSEVATGGNKTFLCIVLYTQTIESSNYLDDESALDCDVNCSRENAESSADRRGRVPFKAVLSSGSDESGSILPKSIIPSLDVVIRYVKGSQIFEFGPGTQEKLD